MKIDLLDVNDAGLILKDGSIIPWTEIDVIGKCEHPCSGCTWAHYYLRKKGNPQNYRIPTLGGFSLFEDETNQRELKMKIIEFGSKLPHIRFVSRLPIFGKESPWKAEKDMELLRYWGSPQAQKSRLEYEKRATFIICVFFVGIVLFFLVMFLIGKLRH